MANTTEQILLTLGARNNASSVFGQVDKDAKNMASSISSAISNINSGLMNIGSVTENMMQGLTGKSAMDNILGTTSKAETNKVLIGMMTETEEAADSLFTTVDNVTNESLTSMQDLIPAMNAFSSATGASDKDLESVTDEMANFGAAVLAQTGSTDLAQQSMMDLSKGIKGAFASLDQYGVSEDALMRTGLWSGKEDDVKGYMDAVEKVIGSTDELMDTNQGLDALIGKAFSRGGKKIGNEFLPVIKDIKKGFIELDNSLGGNLTASILAVSGGVEVMNQGLWNVSTTVNGVRDLADGFKFLADKIKGVTEAAETASDAINTASNVSDIGAGVSSAGAISGGATKTISGVENIALDGLGSWDAIDLITNSKKEQKATAEAEKQIGKLVNRKEKLLNNIVDTDDEQLIKKLKKGVASADSKLSNGDLEDSAVGSLLQFNENTVDKLIHEDDGLSDAIKDSFSKQGTKISDAAEHGGKSLQKGLKKMVDVPSKMSGYFHSFTESFSDSIKNFKDAGVKGNFKKLDQKLLSVFKGTEEISDVLDVADDVGDMTKTVTGAEKIAEGMSSVAGAGSTMAAAAPEMEAAAAGGAAVEAGATGLAATFTSLMVPLLAVSAAIIIMIPIVAVIAAEAMIFIRLLADFMEALNFDNVNLDGAINGISQVATALAWVGVAMAAMSFASIMTGLAVITGGFLGITGPLDVAVNAIKEVGEKLSQFNTLSINPSVATNLKNISDSLMAVSSAMGALTWTNITTGFSNWISGALGFGSVTDALSQAKDDLIKASTEINTLAGEITPIDEDKAKNIQNVCDSLASVGDAIGALRSIRDGQNWDNLFGGLMEGLFGKGVDIKTALDNVKTDIKDAADALSGWDLPDIDEEGKLGEKIKKVSDTLTSVNDAFQTLRGLRDDNNWDDWIGGIFEGSDIKTAIGDVVTDINEAASALSGLSLDNFGEDSTIGDNVKNVSDALTSVSEAATTLTNLPPMDNFDSSQITTAVTNLQTAATELSNINETTFDSESVNSVLTNVQTALENLKTTLSSASGFTETSIGIGTQIVSGVQTGLDPLGPAVQGKVASAIDSAKPTANTYGKGLGFNASEGFKSSLKLADTMTTEMGYVKTAVDNGIAEAKTAAQNGAQEVVEAFKSGINVGSPGDIARAMKGEMNYTKEAILNAYPKLKESAYNAASLIVNSFGNPKLNPDLLFLTNNNPFDIGALETTTSQAPIGDNRKTVIIEVHEGAVSVDARNKTEKEARGIMTLALESLDNITDIDVDV